VVVELVLSEALLVLVDQEEVVILQVRLLLDQMQVELI
jgi:hypothetical protein